MEIKGRVHLLFEQSGTFKNEFRKLGYEAFDYDIQNGFGQTDFQIDLFKEIDAAATRERERESIFDRITPDDLCMAFFPCVYFETIQQLVFCLSKHDQRNKPITERIASAMERLDKRTEFHKRLYRLLWIAYDRNIRLIIENPATAPNYLITGQNFPPPTFIDKDRMMRGDVFKKPTAYWFVNCEPTYGESFQKDKEQKIIDRSRPSHTAGICSMERSLISPDYARAFIHDFILGKPQNNTQLSLF